MPTPPNLTPPAGNSRSGSPSGDQPKARVVSGSLRDRIARFENPAAAPLLPTRPFGTSGPAHPSTTPRGGLVGNRIPSLDPKTAGIVGGNRKISENRGTLGNRIPSGTIPAVGATKVASSTGARSASPSGSVDSSSASGAFTSGSPITSRSSSPPSSPGLGLQTSGLLSATEPDNGGPGAMTPSSTRAEAGEEVSQFSAPSTPVQNPVQTSGHYDLVPSNLKLASGESVTPSAAQIALTRGLSTVSNAGSVTGAQSLGSSRMSQYDPSSQGGENPETMLKDVSGVSTPQRTPIAGRRELEGEGSVRGEGSVVGETDMEDLGRRLEGLGVEGADVDRDPTPEPPARPDSPVEEAKEGGFVKATDIDGKITIDDEPEQGTPPAAHPNDLPDPSQPSKEDAKEDIPIDAEEHIDEIAGPISKDDPNAADDLADLKAGKLSQPKAPHGTHTNDQNPINNIMEAGLGMGLDEQIVSPEEMKEQGGVAGQTLEEVERPDAVEAPKKQSDDYAEEGELDVRTATGTDASASGKSPSADSQSDKTPPAKDQAQDVSEPKTEERGESASTVQEKYHGMSQENMPDIIEGKHAAGIRLDDAEQGGAGPLTSGEVDQLKDHLNEQRRKEAEEDADKESESADLKDQLQTEEDRDEGKSRREQLIEALDQNKDADTNLEDEVDDDAKTHARDVTAKITKDLRETEEEGDNEEDVEKKAAENKGEKKETVQADKETQDAGKANLKEIEDNAGDEDDKTSTDDKKPLQVQIEPAPIAQPAEDVDEAKDDSEKNKDVLQENQTEAEPTEPPAFPTPPNEDPDVVDPITPAEPSSSNAADQDEAAPTSPIDSSVLKSFPVVPDEEKPRVEVHVSQSPMNSPMKGIHKEHQPEMPSGKMPEKDQNLSAQSLADKAGTTESEEGRKILEVDMNPGETSKATKRLSTRRAPKSPLLDDEDPGDFEPGEGWAVVTKGRDSD